jgi:ElaB/YqjD/DUF883 family membrane-anchored ribosome-binding protein
MAADSALASELAALKEELAALHRERRARPADQANAGRDAQRRSDAPQAAAGEPHHLHGELRDLVKMVTECIEEAETNIKAHPTATVVGTLLVGILIGRLLGRR